MKSLIPTPSAAARRSISRVTDSGRSMVIFTNHNAVNMGSCQFSKKVELGHCESFLGDFLGDFFARMTFFAAFFLLGPAEVGAPAFLDFRSGPVG